MKKWLRPDNRKFSFPAVTCWFVLVLGCSDSSENYVDYASTASENVLIQESTDVDPDDSLTSAAEGKDESPTAPSTDSQEIEQPVPATEENVIGAEKVTAADEATAADEGGNTSTETSTDGSEGSLASAQRSGESDNENVVESESGSGIQQTSGVPERMGGGVIPGAVIPGAVITGAELLGSETPAEPLPIQLLIPHKTFRKERGSNALRVTYDDIDLLKVLNMEPVPVDAVEHFPEWLSSLDGQRIRIRGFMFPTFQATGVVHFTLARDNGICCFVRKPKIYDIIEVSLTEGAETDYIEGKPFDVEGVFHIEPIVNEMELFGLFRIDDARVLR
ncbi:MAG: DUF3299 domain-containing protein [Planctomycetaceae bacterium]